MKTTLLLLYSNNGKLKYLKKIYKTMKMLWYMDCNHFIIQTYRIILQLYVIKKLHINSFMAVVCFKFIILFNFLTFKYILSIEIVLHFKCTARASEKLHKIFIYLSFDQLNNDV